jgi:3-deoxy-D-manno-octulosonic-acid transferase
MTPAFQPDGFETRVMVTRHPDAEPLAQALRAFGLGLIRGSGAAGRGGDRGGGNAFREAAAGLRNGVIVAMTADVPPGPAYRCGLGIIKLAQVSGRPIFPLALSTSREITLKSWDRMSINLPFSRIGWVSADPIWVPGDFSSDDLEKARHNVEYSLNEATKRARSLAETL